MVICNYYEVHHVHVVHVRTKVNKLMEESKAQKLIHVDRALAKPNSFLDPKLTYTPIWRHNYAT